MEKVKLEKETVIKKPIGKIGTIIQALGFAGLVLLLVNWFVGIVVVPFVIKGLIFTAYLIGTYMTSSFSYIEIKESESHSAN